MSEQHIDGGRRAFLRSGGLTSDSREQISAQSRPLGLLPPGLAAAVAQDHCSDCDAPCAASCPQQVIQRHPVDHALEGRPWLDFNSSHCTYCGECFAQCPHSEVENAAEAILPIGLVGLANDQCLAWNGVICVSCRFACDEKAIKVDAMSRPSIENARCNGCGQCVSTCPQSALTVEALDA